MATAILVEYLRRPSLDLRIAPPGDTEYTLSSRPFTKRRSLSVILDNKTLPWWAKWMLRTPALQCRAAISFHYFDDHNDIFGRAMEGRWSGSPEPVPIALAQNAEGQLLALIPEWRGVDVLPGDREHLDIFVRGDDDEECYGWNNDSYFCTPPWRNPQWKLSRGRYLVKVNITSSGQKFTKWFRLENSGDRTSCRLEPY